MNYNENGRKYEINKDYFKKWSHNMAYILGFIYADGNLDKSKYRLRISSIDLQILENISTEIESSRPIIKESNKIGEWYTMTVDDRVIYTDLKKLGLTPNKTNGCEVPVIPKDYKYDFVRGYFDGDGSVYSKKHKDSSIPTLAIDIATNSISFRKGYIKLFDDIVDEGHKMTCTIRKDGLNIMRSNTVVSERLYNKMYYPDCLCIKRKKDKFDEILEQRRHRKKKLPKIHKV